MDQFRLCVALAISRACVLLSQPIFRTTVTLFYALWITALFCSFFVHCFSETVPFFLYRCHTRFQPFPIDLKWTLHFALSFLVITDAFSLCWTCFLIIFLFILLLELSYPSCVPVTQGLCDIFPLSPRYHSTLILSFESLLTHFHNYIV